MSNKTQLSNNNTKLASLIQELQGKAAGSGGASVETCTVTLSSDSSNYRPYYYSYTHLDDSGNITGTAVETNSNTTITLENVLCGSVVTIYWYRSANTQQTNADSIARNTSYFNAYRITAPAGGAAQIASISSGGSSGGGG